MNYTVLFSMHQLAALYDWLLETGELYVHFEYPHSGGSGTSYLVRTLAELKQLITDQKREEIEIFILRRMIFPIRGIADESLLDRALQEIPDGQYYTIVSPDYYPSVCAPLADGNSHLELRKGDLPPVIGRNRELKFQLLERFR